VRLVQGGKKEYLQREYSENVTMVTYRAAGVDIDAGEKLVQRIKSKVRSTFNRNVLADIGTFGAFYRASFRRMKDPVLVSSVDGVGTKLKIAFLANRHDTVGQDLVNHCVNDILVCGARPLFFLDYFGTGSLDLAVGEQVVGGFAKACRENDCALIGGETAEMPGMYAQGEYDLAGTIVGVVERSKILGERKIRPGDVLIGLPSTGLQTNGYSLARSVLLAHYGIDNHVAELGMSLADELLKIHRSYFRVVFPMLSRLSIKGMAHITGGGIEGNTRRILPAKTVLRIDWDSWPRPPIFSLIQRLGSVPEEEMRRTFNLGIGMVLITRASAADSVIRALRKKRERPVLVGDVVRA
jgi:phosphoribosylformylglycinamidine cyclo-ligase